MTHASAELIDAMRGIGGWVVNLPASSSACGFGVGPVVYAWLYRSPAHSDAVDSVGDLSRIDCPDCLRLMRAAIDPVRWDHLETLGLAPKLEAT